jgi:hypothetical protein
MKRTNISRLNDLSIQEFEKNFLNKRQPIIAAKSCNWPAVEKWNKNYFKTLYPEKIVTLKVLADDLNNLNEDFSPLKLRLPEALDLIYNNTNSNKKYYLMQQSIYQEFPDLLKDIELPRYANSAGHKINLWLGEAGLNTRPHYDTYDNFLVQVMGRKLVRLFSPVASDNMYPYSIQDDLFPNDSPVYISRIMNTDFINYSQFPKLKNVECFESILEPGDLLFIPSGWWHEVKSLDLSISVNFWWKIKLENFSQQLKNLVCSFLYWYKDEFDTVINDHFDCSSFKDDIQIAEFFFSNGQKCIAAFFLLNYFHKILNNKQGQYKVSFNTEIIKIEEIQNWNEYLEIAKEGNDQLIDDKDLLDIIQTLKLNM